MAWGAELVSSAGGAIDRLAVTWVSVQPGDYDPSTGRGEEWGKAAPAGLLIWLFMGAALFFLIKSMNRHIKRVPKSFDAASPTDAGTDGAAAGDEWAGQSADAAAGSRMTVPPPGSDSADDEHA